MSLLRCLGVYLPSGWIARALDATGKTTIRQRRLPAEVVVWIVIALSIFRGRSISEVVESLDLALPNEHGGFVCKSAIAQARRRLGYAPIKSLFQLSASEWTAGQSSDQTWRGMSLWAVDGTSVKAPDSPENRDTFRAQVYLSGKQSSYPQVRVVALTSLPSRILAGAAFGSYTTNEMRLAPEVFARIPDQSLTLLDKGFFSASLLLGLKCEGRSRHFLIPARSNSKWKSSIIDQEDALVTMEVSKPARQQSPDLPKEWTARAIRTIDCEGNVGHLLTSLLDQHLFPAEELRALYSQRWEVETSYNEIKVAMFINSLTLRSQTPDGVNQELWGAFLGYNLVRLLIADVARSGGISPVNRQNY